MNDWMGRGGYKVNRYAKIASWLAELAIYSECEGIVSIV